MKPAFAFILLLVLAAPAWALQIDLDFTYDQMNGDFFGQHQVAKTALLKAASDIGALINSPLGAVTQNEFIGTSGPATVTLDMYGTATNPVTRVDFNIDPVSLAANHV